jgi:NAD(P)H-dependent flavin oxidoreductase YrpB (nitropropane dioxygenase family)
MKYSLLKTTSGYFNRRDLLRNMALIGVGGIAATTLQSGTLPLSTIESDFRAETLSGEQTKLTVQEIYTKAREALYPDCRVCFQCDGVACAGESNMGGVGSGMSFRNNFLALQRISLKMRTLVDDPALAKVPDTSTTIFGQKLSFPAIAAPIGPRVLNTGKGIEKDRYYDAIIGGCVDAGVVGAIGDNVTLPLDVFKKHCGYIAAVNGRSLIGLKPRPAKDMIPLLQYIEEAGTFMIDIDTDTGGRFPVADLRKIIQSTKLPVVVKGVMTIDDAKRAADAGAAGIVVSNHGGRRLDYTQGTADVLPAIADAMKGELVIMADGCVHYGADVLKYLALGADVVLVGRHIVRAAFGGGREGVALFMKIMQQELVSAMSMTAVSSIKKINRDILV